ncbi:MAG: M23 family metallopeptidase [Anaerolineae bacterium]|nr:M23 family metallopeptidase [Anaerolineae bacterium]
MNRLPLALLALLVLTTLGIVPADIQAQSQCPLAEQVDYPFDRAAYRLAQDFGVPSGRHQGRYHTGEDWFIDPDSTFGQPIRAIAAGRVTYAYPLGWGRDGGVVIIEHTFEDGSVVYSQYGHIVESDSVKFPTRLSCVELGQVIGVIGDARPAPHLHFEIKLAGPDNPGPGYSWVNPYDEGWRSPSKFIINRQAWTHPAYRWRLILTDPTGFNAPPLQLEDQSLMYRDGGTLRMATYDGRVLWRIAQTEPIVAVLPYQGQPMVVYRDGTITLIDYEGQITRSWQIPEINLRPDPFLVGENWVFQTEDDTLIALDADRQTIIWRLTDLPVIARVHVSADWIALLSQDQDLWLIDHNGQLQVSAAMRGMASFATLPDGDLAVYGRGGLWRVDSAGLWSLLNEESIAITDANAVAITADGAAYTFDGVQLHAPDHSWAIPLSVNGKATLTPIADYLLLTSTDGQMAVMSLTGQLCSALQIYRGASVWATLAEDQILRMILGDQVIGFDWSTLTQPCR